MALTTPVEGPRIVPKGVARTSKDVLPNGRPGFRVTQGFADVDAYFGGKHGALDLGNYNCGDKVLASVAGKVQTRRDSYGALILEIVEPSGARVGYGHLSKFLVAHGATVNRGAPVGLVGDTGLGNVCHIHYSRRSASGALVDPWPLLEQNAIKIEARMNGDGINIRTGPGKAGGSLAPIYATTVGGRVRRASDGKDLGSTLKWRTAKKAVFGASHNLGNHPKSWTPIYVGGGYRSVAYPLTTYR